MCRDEGWEPLSATDDAFCRWVSNNEIPSRIKRITEDQKDHFKWNVENHFKRVPVMTIDQAVALYASKEVYSRAA